MIKSSLPICQFSKFESLIGAIGIITLHGERCLALNARPIVCFQITFHHLCSSPLTVHEMMQLGAAANDSPSSLSTANFHEATTSTPQPSSSYLQVFSSGRRMETRFSMGLQENLKLMHETPSPPRLRVSARREHALGPGDYFSNKILVF